MSDPQELAEDLELAVRSAREAGALALELFRGAGLAVEEKRDGSPVTEADRRTERRLRELLLARHPDDGVLGEEEEPVAGTSGRTWILDPVDGTVSFVHGVPLWGTLVGLEVEGEAALGVVQLPALDETVHAARGLGATWRQGDAPPRPARVSTVARLEEATLCTTSALGFAEEDLDAPWRRLLAAVGEDRGWGDCYAHALVATGRAEIVLEPRMSVWDCAALLPILEEAGGAFTDLEGRRTIRGGNALASNGRLHVAALEALRG